jgi:hypothetical protein
MHCSMLSRLVLFFLLLISKDLFTEQFVFFYVYNGKSFVSLWVMMQVQNISFIIYIFLIGLYVQSNVEDCNLTRKTIDDFSTHTCLAFFFSFYYYWSRYIQKRSKYSLLYFYDEHFFSLLILPYALYKRDKFI